MTNQGMKEPLHFLETSAPTCLICINDIFAVLKKGKEIVKSGIPGEYACKGG